MRLEGRNVIITGASSGIGLALAADLLARDCRVWSFSTTIVPMEHPNLTSVLCDVRDASAIEAALRMVDAPVDLLVNNAGVMSRGGVLASSEEEFDMLFDVNVKGSWLVTKLAVPRLATDAHILFVSSRHALRLPDDPALYGLSKKAVLHLAELVERAYPAFRVKVLCPGPVDTPLSRVGVPPEEWEKKKVMMCTPAEMSSKILGLLETEDKSRLVFDMETYEHYLE